MNQISSKRLLESWQSVEGLKNDFDDLDSQTALHDVDGFRHPHCGRGVNWMPLRT